MSKINKKLPKFLETFYKNFKNQIRLDKNPQTPSLNIFCKNRHFLFSNLLSTRVLPVYISNGTDLRIPDCNEAAWAMLYKLWDPNNNFMEAQ